MTTTAAHVGHRPYTKLFTAFFAGLLTATVGLYAGQYVPQALMLPLMIVEIIMIVMMIFVRKKKAVGYGMMFAFMFISGMTLYPVIAYYVSTLGANVVLEAFGITAVSFAGIAIYATVSKRDFTFLGSFLFISLIALVGLGILNIFLPFSSTTQLIYSAFGILIFIGYTLYDFSRLTVHGFTERDIPMIVVSVYLDFVNLFLYILRFIGISRD
ncbi:hypothetical protein EV207_13712 [Scopulibacillus darangshiensis]|uniref:Modulator of FtsH protease n=1 Tax=Scopulibacillus darangshiensis TaxID=442528 RepID=A0A4R2NLP5_9BACL|nr:Bax inhibitor-1/YccA family protein [Scopulibacillus darangshiensis]TCP22124.1 hypothetical protein EV207_13712 [Scopulibacillus darangshiensis]